VAGAVGLGDPAEDRAGSGSFLAPAREGCQAGEGTLPGSSTKFSRDLRGLRSDAMTAGTVPFSNIGAGAIRPRKPQKAWRAALDCPGPSARVSPWAPRAYARARRVSPGGAGRAGASPAVHSE